MAGLADFLQGDLSGMDHATLYRLRELAKSQQEQDQLAGYEHRAFAREAVGDNPLMSIPIGLAAPLYQISKFMPGNKSRSNPGLWQLGQAYTSIGEGLMSLLGKQ
jgi:hypothetical protein